MYIKIAKTYNYHDEGVSIVGIAKIIPITSPSIVKYKSPKLKNRKGSRKFSVMFSRKEG